MFYMSMETRIWPVGYAFCQPMLHRVVVNIVDVTLQIGFIADGMLPEGALPYALFPLAALAFRTLGHRRQIP